MRIKLPILLLTVIALVGLSGAYVVGSLQAYSRYQQDSVDHQQHCGGQSPVHICVHTPSAIFSAFYPSYVANDNPLFTIDYSSTSPIVLVVNASVVNLTSAQSYTVTAGLNLQSMSIIPPLITSAFRKLTTEYHTTFHVQITDTSKHLYYVDDIPVTFHSRWLMEWSVANRLKIAAWVTPDDPAITTLVLKAFRHLPSESPPVPEAMVGYNNANSKQVVTQVNAIYDALRLDYGMQYEQASVPYTGHSGSDSSSAPTQNIKLPAEVLQQRSGMCIELTLVLASAVEHIGLHAEIVIIPGHAFLGVAVTPDNKHFEYWDAVQINNKVAGDSANIATDEIYRQNLRQHTIVDTIVISDARNANIEAML